MNLETKYELISSDWKKFLLSLKEIFSQNLKTLIYVYPRDNTPGCTLENKSFSCLKNDFEKLGVALFGLSQDSIESHQVFQNEHSIEIPLLSDIELLLHKELWAYGEKNNYGKIVTWVIRSTFLFNQEGTLLKSWMNVKATGHAEKILKELQK